MTANQVAYAQVQENARHNLKTEGESERHDKEVESIQHDANTITQEGNRLTAEYNSERNRIQEEYNKAYLALQKAQGDERLSIEREMNALTKRKQDLDAKHNTAMEGLQSVANEIASRRQMEEARHNERAEKIMSDYNTEQIALRNKEIEYTATFQRVQNYLRGAELNESIRQHNLIDNAATQDRLVRLRETNSLIALNSARTTATKVGVWTSIADTITNSIYRIGRVLPGMDKIGGLLQGGRQDGEKSQAQKQFEELFED